MVTKVTTPKIIMQQSTVNYRALGLLEVQSWSASMAALDAATKAAEVVVIQAELNDQLGVCMKLTGDTSSVSAALDAGRAMAESMRVKCIIDLIPAPAKEAFAGMMGKPE